MKKLFLLFLILFLLQCSKDSVRGDLPIDYILIHQKIQIDELEREYIVFKPKTIKKNIILVGLHGRGGTGEEFMQLTKFNQIAEEEGFIVVYPTGINRAWIDGRNLPEESKIADDEKFLITLKNKLEKEYSIKNTYLFGYSNGGFMAQKMALSRLDSFSGYASIVSTMSENISKSKPTYPNPVLFINGTEDPIVPYKGGLIKGDKGVALSAEDTVKQWVRRNKCTVRPESEIINERDDGVKVFIHNYTSCKSGKIVRFLKLEGAGHGWPGKLEHNKPDFGTFTTEIDASEEIWKFFKSLPRKN